MIEDKSLYDLVYFSFLFLGVFIISLLIIPKIRRLSIKLNFTDIPDNRSSHTSSVPSFGGVAFYISYIIVLFFSQSLDIHYVSLTLLVSISILFFTGLFDDMRDLSPRIKFLGQFIAVSILMTQPDFRILSLHGFMGIYEIPLYLSIFGSTFFLLGLINAVNLIDGIDGLTGITGILIASCYSFIFYELGYFFYLSISITTIATLLAFLRFNFSRSRKIFMGDTGSLVIGLVMGVLTLKLMSLGNEAYSSLSFKREQLPLFLIAVLFVPILDIMRVMFLRAVRGVSMFRPDRNHVHHIITDFGFSHLKASFFIGTLNFMAAVIMFFVIQRFTFLASFFLLIALFFIAIVVLFMMDRNLTALKLKAKIKRSMLKMLSL